jgi:hypothetical protein
MRETLVERLQNQEGEIVELRRQLDHLVKEKAEDAVRIIELEDKLSTQAEAANDAAMMSAERAQTIDMAFQAAQEEISMLKKQLSAGMMDSTLDFRTRQETSHSSTGLHQRSGSLFDDIVSSPKSFLASTPNMEPSNDSKPGSGFLSSVWGVAKRLGNTPNTSNPSTPTGAEPLATPSGSDEHLSTALNTASPPS